MIAILKDGSRWKPLSPDKRSTELLRLYSNKAIAGYVLSGVPKQFVSLNLYAAWDMPSQQTK